LVENAVPPPQFVALIHFRKNHSLRSRCPGVTLQALTGSGRRIANAHPA
jgi:hypothetical protein